MHQCDAHKNMRCAESTQEANVAPGCTLGKSAVQTSLIFFYITCDAL